MSPHESGQAAPEFYRSLLDHSPDMLAVTDASGRVVYVTPSVLELIGFTPSERIGQSMFDPVHPDDLAENREALDAFMATPGAEREAEFRLIHKDGGLRVVHARARNLLDDPAVNGVVFHLRDVTSHRAAEQDRDRARELLTRVITYAPVILFVINPEGVFELSEGRGLRAVGLEPGEAVGQNVFEQYQGAEVAIDLIRRALAGEEVEGETPLGDRIFHTLITPIRGARGAVEAVQGVSFDVTEREHEARSARFRARVLEAIGEAVIATDTDGVVIFWNRAAEKLYGWTKEEALGQDVRAMTQAQPTAPANAGVDLANPPDQWSGEYTVTRKDGERIPVYMSTVALREGGEATGLVGVSTDLRDRRGLEEQLRQAQKMEAVGRLAGGVAHDFNNLLTAIGGYAGVAAERAEDEQLAADISEIVHATDRARSLVDKLLAFSRRTHTAPRSVDLNQVILSIVGLLRRMIGADIALETALAPGLWPVYTDPSQIEQAIVNLALNARDAMPDGGTITLRTDRVALDDGRAGRVNESMGAGDYVRLMVTDTGTGIEPAVRERIFEPFFTTKEVGKGSGLGLSIVFGEVTRVGGGVVVESTPGEGSTFSLYLPVSREPVVPEPESRPSPAVRRAAPSGSSTSTGADQESAERILLVEDEASVRMLARRVLEREGYTVMQAESGRAAESLMETLDSPPDLLLTDVIMPEMGGAELVERLTPRHPSLRVLYMSGYTADELASRGVDETRDNFLPKPFTPEQLRVAVRRALGG